MTEREKTLEMYKIGVHCQLYGDNQGQWFGLYGMEPAQEGETDYFDTRIEAEDQAIKEWEEWEDMENEQR